VQAFEPPPDAAGQAALREEFAEGIGGGGEPSGNPDSRPGKPADHLAQRRVLAADPLDIGHPEPIEIHDVLEPGHGCPSSKLKDLVETVILQTGSFRRISL